jgi:peptide/nickel transport system ATP-binding protein
MSPILRIRGLQTDFATATGTVRALHGVDLDLAPGETLAIVGESGSGKSVTALSIMRLLPERSAEIVNGEVLLGDRDLVKLSEDEMRKIRGEEISMIFQEPMTSLNPVMKIGDQIAEVLSEHRSRSRQDARQHALDLLRRVRIADAERRLDDYPHRLSGGMRQRVMIAMALACAPKILIADEPTTALDVTIQAQILALLSQLQENSNTAIILITHNLGVVAEMAQRVAVMYAGSVVEYADVETLFADPLHPYTQGLLGATPNLDDADLPADGRLVEIPGIVPPLDRLPDGCAFAPRCPRAIDRCRVEKPVLTLMPDARKVACLVAQAERGAA